MPPVLCGDGEGVSRGRLWPEGVVPDIAEPLVRHPLGIDGGGRRVRRVTDVRGEFVTEGVVVAVLVVGKHLGSLFTRLDVELGLVFGHAEPCREVVLEVLADRLHLMRSSSRLLCGSWCATGKHVTRCQVPSIFLKPSVTPGSSPSETGLYGTAKTGGPAVSIAYCRAANQS